MSDAFVHLHTHSEYSMLDGLGKVKELVKEAKRLGQPALALTDHGVMHGAIEFFRACKGAEIKPIIGVEAYQTVWGRPMGGRDPQFDRENYHLLLLAQNMTGYRNLLKIASHSQMDGYYYKPRVDHDFLAQHAEGVVCTTGCLGAEVPQLLNQGKEKEAYERLGWYVDVFGKENFFIELQEHSIDELIPVNKKLVEFAGKFDLQLLATNDVHYVKAEDADPHEMLLCVQTGASIKSDKRMKLSDQSYFLKSRAQMEETFRPLIDLPASAFDNSVLIAEMCDVDLEDDQFHLPDIEIPEGFDYGTYLRHLTEEALPRLYGEERANSPEVQERKERELSVINQMGFDVYFLIVADLCNFARSRNIWWNVRGSGAGSLVAYCTGITGLDPLKNNLIFERFLNPARVTMPDFDLDFPDDQREELIRYTIDKYGDDQVAQIVTFGRMKARAAIRDVGRAQEISLADVDRVAKMIPAIPGKPVTIQDVLTEGHEFYNPELVELYNKETWVKDLLEMSMNLEGVARHSGIHAAAVIVADRELTHYTPLMRPSKGSITESITQFEFPVLESIGLLKVDFLGLSTLSVIREACRLIKERHGVEFDLGNIPFEGEITKRAFDLLASGEVSGVFQVESQGMRRVLTEMRPTLFEHIIATISLYRPGPLEYIPKYIRVMHGEEEIEYKHPALAPILEETLGIIIYQEQIIQILTNLAGYTPGEADLVRRAISKKKASEIEKHKKIFIDGCYKNGIDKKSAAAIYGDIEFFARYGFNKAHAADYAVICVQTAYLKALYPVDYMAALLLIERDKTEKVVNFINECRRMGIDVLPPDVNYSGLDFEIQQLPEDTPTNARRDSKLSFDFPVPEGSAIRFGMAAVKNVGEKPVQAILEARAEGGPFSSLEDFCDRVDLRKVGKRPLECLIKVGAFDRFGKRSQLLDVLDQMVAHSAGIHSARDTGQLSMFDLMGDAGVAEVTPIILPEMEECKGRERLQWEKELLGVYAMSHPMQQISFNLEGVITCHCNELDEEHDGRNVTLAGMIASVRTINTKKGDPMAFVQLEDLQGQCEVVVFPRTYAEVKEQLVPDTVVLVKGKAQTREGQTSLLADSFQTYVEQAVAIAEEESRYQEPLPLAPTINGVAVHEGETPYAANGNGTANGSTHNGNGSNGNGSNRNGSNGSHGAWGDANGTSHGTGHSTEESQPVVGEESPFAHEPPSWMSDLPPVPGTVGADASDAAEPAMDNEDTDHGGMDGDDKDTPVAEVAEVAEMNDSSTATPETAEPETPESEPPESEPAESKSAESEADEQPVVAMRDTQADAAAANDESQSPPTVGADPSDPRPAEPVAHTAGVSNGNGGHDAGLQSNGHSGNGHASNGHAENGHAENGHANNGGNGNGASSSRLPVRNLHIVFHRSGHLDRDKFRLKEIYDRLRDPRGRDQFSISIEGSHGRQHLTFPQDYCTINERLMGELRRHFRVDVAVDGG